METKKISGKLIQIYTIIIYIIAIIIFEIGYCNTGMITNLVNHAENTIDYNFSLCRIVIYCLFIILYLIFRKKFVETAVEVSENKYKRVFIYLTSIITILVLGITLFKGINKPEILRTMSIASLTALMGNLFIIYVSNNNIKNIIVTLSTFGILFSITTDFNHMLDEKKHFMSAYNVAYFNFDYVKNPVTDKKIEELEQLSDYTKIDKFLEKAYIPEITGDVDLDDMASIPADYSAILYMPSALGIRIAGTLQGSILDMYILGRIFNLIAYGTLICIALKILPFKKNIFSTIFLIPFMLLLAATYSVDGICVGLISIFIAYCLKLYKENETINLKQFLILIGLFLLTLFAKSMAYIAICLIAFILPFIKTLKKNKKYLPIIIGITIILLIIAAIVATHFLKGKMTEGDPRGVGEINPAEQINYITNNPKAFVNLMINHLRGTLLNFNWYAILHPAAYFEANAGSLMLLILIFVLYVSLTEDDINFKLKEKIVLIISFLIVVITTSMPLYILYTAVGADHIEGYQTRYILPVIALPLMCISNNKFKSISGKNRVMNIAIISGIFIAIGLNQLLLIK